MPYMEFFMCMACWLPSQPLLNPFYNGLRIQITQVHATSSESAGLTWPEPVQVWDRVRDRFRLAKQLVCGSRWTLCLYRPKQYKSKSAGRPIGCSYKTYASQTLVQERQYQESSMPAYMYEMLYSIS